jgi:hypothetical protein
MPDACVPGRASRVPRGGAWITTTEQHVHVHVNATYVMCMCDLTDVLRGLMSLRLSSVLREHVCTT